MPPGLAQAPGPVLEQIAEMTIKIKHCDRQIQLLGQTEYPETPQGIAVTPFLVTGTLQGWMGRPL